MKFKIGVFSLLLSFLGVNAFADSSVIVCEGDGAGGHVHLKYHSIGPGQYEALLMTYGGNDILEDPKSVFNHMGFIFFRGSHGIEFNLSEFSSDFSVTVPAFGRRLKTTEGQCRME